jgi:hypothetical protein
VFLSDDGNTNCFGSLCFYFLSPRRLERERRRGGEARGRASSRGVQNNRLTEKTDIIEEKLTEKTKPK